MTVLSTTRDELAGALAGRRGIGVVMTMGALHDGHVALIRTARARCETVVVTIFVNPLQFGPHEDFERYPRPLEADLGICEEEKVDVVFAPRGDVIYPGGLPQVTVSPGRLGEVLEGAHRPGHFAGVLTVVCKLLHFVGPEATFFGEKDYQQLVLVRKMTSDLGFDVEIVAVPIVREPDGLALSSRNRYLSAAERDEALALSRALAAGLSRASDGAAAVLDATARVLEGIAVDYLSLTAPDLGPAPERGEARLLVAARVGPTRLLDNTAVRLLEP